jgi:hypothetical protein
VNYSGLLALSGATSKTTFMFQFHIALPEDHGDDESVATKPSKHSTIACLATKEQMF